LALQAGTSGMRVYPHRSVSEWRRAAAFATARHASEVTFSAQPGPALASATALAAMPRGGNAFSWLRDVQSAHSGW
ncbi:MAG: hypothetical protein J2P29_13870, partial [Actinobacteria bacterium]|nr:hypothetical protein [Actinomycetota bacterium]